jgi:hypothetical protein
MPWGWDGTGEKSVALGGRRGTVEEAAEAKAWPKYEVEYLKHRLDNPAGKYLQANDAAQEVKDHILLEKAAEDYKEEADECLKAEFKDWLAGRHPDNIDPQVYFNGAGKPVRRYTYRDQLVHAPKNADGSDKYKIGDPMMLDAEENGSKYGWKPTWWGDTQLTHLPGVRDYLKESEKKRSDADMYMNLLAEHGPQDLRSAWMYFKHWVKARPLGPETCPTDDLSDPRATAGDIPEVPGVFVSKFQSLPTEPVEYRYKKQPPVGERSDFHNNMPSHLRNTPAREPRTYNIDLLQNLTNAIESAVVDTTKTNINNSGYRTPEFQGKGRNLQVDFQSRRGSRRPMSSPNSQRRHELMRARQAEERAAEERAVEERAAREAEALDQRATDFLQELGDIENLTSEFFENEANEASEILSEFERLVRESVPYDMTFTPGGTASSGAYSPFAQP